MLAFSFIFFTSCTEEDDDIARPSTTLISPTAEADYALGTEIEMKAYFTDDLDLDNYLFKIRPASDDWPVQGFSTDVEGDIEGEEETVSEFVTIPETNEDGSPIGAGPHIVSVFCSDRVTQYSDTLEVEINIYNPADEVAPLIVITAPANLAVPFTADSDDNDIAISGTISDDSGIARITYSYVQRDEDLTPFEDEDYPYNATLDGEAPTTYEIVGNSDPAGAGTFPYFKAPDIGEYNLVITAYDVYNNSSSISIPVNVNK